VRLPDTAELISRRPGVARVRQGSGMRKVGRQRPTRMRCRNARKNQYHAGGHRKLLLHQVVPYLCTRGHASVVAGPDTKCPYGGKGWRSNRRKGWRGGGGSAIIDGALWRSGQLAISAKARRAAMHQPFAAAQRQEITNFGNERGARSGDGFVERDVEGERIRGPQL